LEIVNGDFEVVFTLHMCYVTMLRDVISACSAVFPEFSQVIR